MYKLDFIEIIVFAIVATVIYFVVKLFIKLYKKA
jgi:large-conductance mechanosensitive channel